MWSFSLGQKHDLVCFLSRRLCNTIMFGMGPTDDPQDGVSLDDVCDEITSAVDNSTTDQQ